MARIRDEHHPRGGHGDLPISSANGSGPARNVPPPRPTVAPGPTVRPTKRLTAVKLVRYGLPAAIILAGIVIVIVVPGTAGVEGAVTMFGICLCVTLFNGLVRLGVSGDRDRDTEAAARDQYDKTGAWPDEHRRGS